ncbi:MAG: threonine ammonia-lyase, partial [Nitrospirales bacterium]|nr:threonine ammonia-lyase [Nitrospirales bacterium]
DDVPGSLYRVTGIIAEKRGNVLHVDHDRLDDAIPLGKTLVTFTVEVKGPAHRGEIINSIRDAGFSTRDA